jgi:hypothetical protein
MQLRLQTTQNTQNKIEDFIWEHRQKSRSLNREVLGKDPIALWPPSSLRALRDLRAAY